MELRHSRILGMGSFVPPRVVTNDDLTQWMETSHEWIAERTGIEERRWVPDDGSMSGAQMAANASREALDNAGLEPGDVDMIIYATLSPDHNFPGTGCFLQRELELIQDVDSTARDFAAPFAAVVPRDLDDEAGPRVLEVLAGFGFFDPVEVLGRGDGPTI